MTDRLVAVLDRFELQARVFQSGTLCRNARFDATNGVGYIHVLRAGSLRLRTPGARPRAVTEPSVIFFPRPADHELVPDVPDGAELYCASVEFGAGMHNPLTRAVPEVIVVPLAASGTLADALGLLFAEASEDHCGRQAVIDRVAEVVVVLVLRYLMDADLVETGVLAGLADPHLMKAINAMHAEPSNAWSVETLAAAAGMSRARFAARFRAVVGRTPGAYLGDWRVSLAQSLLRRGKPVNVVANEVGYESASALARVFSGRLGMSPTAWVRQQAGQARSDRA